VQHGRPRVNGIASGGLGWISGQLAGITLIGYEWASLLGVMWVE